jgi:hypothetical protein
VEAWSKSRKSFEEE